MLQALRVSLAASGALKASTKVADLLSETTLRAAERQDKVEALAGVRQVRLKSWLAGARLSVEEGAATTEVVQALESLPSQFRSGRSGAVDRHVADLHTWALREGSLRVPQHHRTSEGSPLGSWLASMRVKLRQGSVDEILAARLRAIPHWEDNPSVGDWDLHLAAFNQYYERDGTGHVASQYIERMSVDGDETDLKLGQWVQHQRQSPPTGERLARLQETPGWLWRAIDAAWEKRRLELDAFLSEHGRMPRQKTGEERLLALWLNNQRTKYKTGRLPPGRIALLEGTTGWSWGTRRNGRPTR